MNNTAIAKCFVEKSATSNARKKKFDMSFLTFANLKRQTHCAYSGVEFNASNNHFTFERIDNSIGYVDGNVIAVESRYNHARGNFENSTQVVEYIRSIKQRTEANLVNLSQLEKLLDTKSAAAKLNPEFVVKPVITAEMYGYWASNYSKIVSISKKIKSCKHSLAESKLAVEKCKRKKGRVHFSKIVEDCEKKLSNLIIRKDLMIEECPSLGNMKTKRFMSYRAKRSELSDQISSLEKQCKEVEVSISKDQNLVPILETVAVALDRFANLTYMERQAIEFGLALDASRTEILKHAVARKLLGDTI